MICQQISAILRRTANYLAKKYVLEYNTSACKVKSIISMANVSGNFRHRKTMRKSECGRKKEPLLLFPDCHKMEERIL
jgi:hypothetical protein